MKILQTIFILILAIGFGPLRAQYFGIPSKTWGIGFGNSPKFTGIRLNFADKDIEQVNGINFSIWTQKELIDETGSINGISLGVPLAVGSAYRNGINFGFFGVGASKKVTGINVGGLGVGSGSNLTGINLGGLGIGASENVTGLNFGGMSVGAGENVQGISASIIAVGCGKDIRGINIAGIAVGAGGSITGINLAGIAVGAGEGIKGLNVVGIAIGSGSEVTGINLSALAVAAPSVKGWSTALVIGGEKIQGIAIAPAYLRIEGNEGYMKGFSFSAFNHIKGTTNGLTIGIFNYTWDIAGIQLGILNYVKNNPRGLKILPLFNTRF